MAVPAAPAVPGVPPAPACAPGDEFELHFIGELESPGWHLMCFSRREKIGHFHLLSFCLELC